MSSDTAVLIEAIDTNLRTAEQVTDRLSPQQFNWRSEPGRWSIAQCLGHLNILNALDLGPLEALIKDAQSGGNPHEIRPKIMKVRNEHEGRIEALPSDAQKKQWKEMLGKRLDL